MKKLSFIVVCLFFIISSCDQADGFIQNDTIPKSDYQTISKSSSYSEQEVSPKFGKPNNTNFQFKVYDPYGTIPLSVKLFEMATGADTYIPMTKSGNYWTVTRKMPTNGWFHYRYVFTSTKLPVSPSVPAYQMCVTRNVFIPSGTSNITWPFGADTSSFTNRLSWIGSHEQGGCGNNWNENGHKNQGCNADDRLAEDWNKNCQNSADNGAEVRSPLDGKVIKVRIDSPSNHWGGYGNTVDIEQVTANGTYIFRIAHLKYAPPVSEGSWVKAGVTKIGNIGMSGGTSNNYHAHCVLYRAPSCYTGVEFKFNAN